jgi:hypothetical protein
MTEQPEGVDDNLSDAVPDHTDEIVLDPELVEVDEDDIPDDEELPA